MVKSDFVWGARANGTISSYDTVYVGKMDFLIQKLIQLFLNLYGGKKRQDVKMGYVDASRRQLQSVLKIRV